MMVWSWRERERERDLCEPLYPPPTFSHELFISGFVLMGRFVWIIMITFINGRSHMWFALCRAESIRKRVNAQHAVAYCQVLLYKKWFSEITLHLDDIEFFHVYCVSFIVFPDMLGSCRYSNNPVLVSVHGYSISKLESHWLMVNIIGSQGLFSRNSAFEHSLRHRFLAGVRFAHTNARGLNCLMFS